MMGDKLKDGWWDTAIEIISSISFSQIKPRSVNYIERKLKILLKNEDLNSILERIKPAIKEEKEDNVGIIANVIFEVLGEKELTLLQEKVAKNEQFCDYVRDLVFELCLKYDVSKEK